MKGFRVRHEEPPDDTLVVIRGGPLDADVIRRDARMAFLRFGEYGVSVLAASDEEGFRKVASGPLRLYGQLAVTTAGAIRQVGLELRPTFRRPHFTVIFPTLDDGVRLLLACENELIENPHCEPDDREEGR